MWRFIEPKVVFGENALEHLKTITGKKAIIITGKTVQKMAFVEKVTTYLKEAGLETSVFDQVEPNPSIETVKKGAQMLGEVKPDWVIGLGGGSNIDAAKAMWALYERPDLSVYDINPYTRLDLRKKAQFIAIPTTSGTGSEVTWASTITDTEKHRKTVLVSEEIVPDIAIIDPFFPSKMPPWLTADTGLDSLVHTIEAYVSRWSNDFSDALAIKALQLIFHYLPRAYKNMADIEAREKMHYAATMAGMAIGNSQVGIAHSLGHALGATFDVPHGKAVGVFLPYVVEYNSGETGDRYTEIATAINIHDKEGGVIRKLTGKIREFISELNEPLSIKKMEIDTLEFKSNLERLCDYAYDDPGTLGNPRVPTKEEIKKLYMYVWEGKEIDF